MRLQAYVYAQCSVGLTLAVKTMSYVVCGEPVGDYLISRSCLKLEWVLTQNSKKTKCFDIETWYLMTKSVCLIMVLEQLVLTYFKRSQRLIEWPLRVRVRTMILWKHIDIVFICKIIVSSA